MGEKRRYELLFNDRAERYHSCNLVTERAATGELAFLLGGECGVSITNQDFVYLLWGKAEVRVALNDRAERYRSCNLVTERDATGELAFFGR